MRMSNLSPLLAFVALFSLLSCVSAGCSSSEKEAIGLCTVASMHDWKVSPVDIDLRNRKYCCFIWYALECQVKIARGCDYSLAEKLSRETEKAYRNACTLYPRKSPKCGKPGSK